MWPSQSQTGFKQQRQALKPGSCSRAHTLTCGAHTESPEGLLETSWPQPRYSESVSLAVLDLHVQHSPKGC